MVKDIELSISKLIGKAMVDYRMLAEGDKIAVAVSGGKDSLTLLKMLEYRRKFVPIKYELLAVHIDLGYPCQRPNILAEKFLKSVEEFCPNVKTNIFRSVKRIKKDYLL